MLGNEILAKLKKKLLKEKKQLEEQLNISADKNEDGEYEPKFEDFGRDTEDNAGEVEEFTDKVGIVETLSDRLMEIEEALKRMENNTYGKCKNCKNEEIPQGRLEANPAATTCLKCAE